MNVDWSRTSSEKKWSVAANDGAKYSVALPSARPAPAYCSAEPWMNCCRPLRVFGFSVLNSWSRSTTSRVSLAGSVAPAGSAGRLLGPGVSAT